MPFDPSLPAANTPLASAQMRAQLQSIVDLISTIPVGPQGPPGVSVTGAVVDATGTLPPDNPATASASFDGAFVHFDFNIPRGDTGNDGTPGAQGPQGQPGNQGSSGDQGPTGAQGAPGDPGPQGAPGAPGNDGAQGPAGPQGEPGPQGPPGPVTPADLAAAIAGTPSSANAMDTNGISISDPPTQAEVQGILTTLNQLITMLRRP